MAEQQTLEQLCAKVDEYIKRGFKADVDKAARHAQNETQTFIKRTHPQVAFGGKSLIEDNYNKKTHNQIVKGHFKITANVINAAVYANYFARWYATGAKQHLISRKTGRWSRTTSNTTYYEPRGAYFETNKQAIEANAAKQMDIYLGEHIKL